MEPHTCIIPEFGRWRQEKQKFKANRGYYPESKASLGYKSSHLQRKEGERERRREERRWGKREGKKERET